MTEQNITEIPKHIHDAESDVEDDVDTSFSDTDDSDQWVTLLVDPEYQIQITEPHQIKKIKTDKIIAEYISKSFGYVQCQLNQKQFLKHRIIANQFLGLDLNDKSVEIDHINNDRSDNRLENLRIVNRSENQKNRRKSGNIEYEFVDDIPPDSIVVDTYGPFTFENIYYNETDDTFYIFNGCRYRKLHKSQTKQGYYVVHVYDTNDKRRVIYYSKFKREYDLI